MSRESPAFCDVMPDYLAFGLASMSKAFQLAYLGAGIVDRLGAAVFMHADPSKGICTSASYKFWGDLS